MATEAPIRPLFARSRSDVARRSAVRSRVLVVKVEASAALEVSNGIDDRGREDGNTAVLRIALWFVNATAAVGALNEVGCT